MFVKSHATSMDGFKETSIQKNESSTSMSLFVVDLACSQMVDCVSTREGRIYTSHVIDARAMALSTKRVVLAHDKNPFHGKGFEHRSRGTAGRLTPLVA